jgi:hypothetical protein
MKTQEFRDIVFSLHDIVENPHFDRVAFKVINKRIFATLHIESNTANLKLPEIDQKTFCSYNTSVIYPIPNKWGLQGWTTFELDEVPVSLMMDALETAYKNSLA